MTDKFYVYWQPINNLEATYAAADALKTETFDPLVETVAATSGAEPVLAPPKGRDRALEKIALNFKGNASFLVDVVSSLFSHLQPCRSLTNQPSADQQVSQLASYIISILLINIIYNVPRWLGGMMPPACIQSQQ